MCSTAGFAEIPFEWHHHPECELTLTLNSRGWRFIADHIGSYDSHDLVLMPPQMPHTWASPGPIDESNPHVAIVVWFTEPWALQLARDVPGVFFPSQIAAAGIRRSEFSGLGGKDDGIASAGAAFEFRARPPSSGAGCVD